MVKLSNPYKPKSIFERYGTNLSDLIKHRLHLKRPESVVKDFEAYANNKEHPFQISDLLLIYSIPFDNLAKFSIHKNSPEFVQFTMIEQIFDSMIFPVKDHCVFVKTTEAGLCSLLFEEILIIDNLSFSKFNVADFVTNEDGFTEVIVSDKSGDIIHSTKTKIFDL